MIKSLLAYSGDLCSIPDPWRSPGEGHGNPLQYSYLENPMDRGAWWATVHGVAKSRTRLSDFTFTSTNTTLAACAISVSLLLPTWPPLMLQKWRVDSLKLNDDENSDSSPRPHLIPPQGWWWEVHHCLQVGTFHAPQVSLPWPCKGRVCLAMNVLDHDFLLGHRSGMEATA